MSGLDFPRHTPSEHTDYVAIPPIVETVCLRCEVGDGYQRWPCETARTHAALDAALAREKRLRSLIETVAQWDEWLQEVLAQQPLAETSEP